MHMGTSRPETMENGLESQTEALSVTITGYVDPCLKDDFVAMCTLYCRTHGARLVPAIRRPA
jgi:hypothetical protein